MGANIKRRVKMSDKKDSKDRKRGQNNNRGGRPRSHESQGYDNR